MTKVFLILFFVVLIFLVSFSKCPKDNKNNKNNKNIIEKFSNHQLLNIYNEPLQKCGLPGMNSGSWDSKGLCSEKGGGVHQICINNIAGNTKEFSKQTGQSNWSEDRGNDNHCVCLGAWSLYNAKGLNKNSNVLKCDAIPKMSLSNNYVSKFSEGWNKWNGLELNNQIVNGVEALVKDCYKPNDPNPKYLNLKSNYCSFAKNNDVLKKSNYYKKMCS